MPKPSWPKIVPHLWYTKEAEEAARFYAAVFPDSHVDRVKSCRLTQRLVLQAQPSLKKAFEGR